MTRRLRRPTTFTAAVLLGLGAGQAAFAQETPWSLRAGPVAVRFHSRASLQVDGAAVPDADAGVQNNTTLGVEIGYALTPDVTARLAVGYPPTTRLTAAGSLTALVPPLTGTLGEVKYGPAVLSVTYAFGSPGGWRPYVGAGVNYTVVLSTRDGDVSNLKVRNAWGSALEAGLEVPISGPWSAFVDVRKVFVRTRATGTLTALGGPPAEASITLDPLLVHAGIGYRF